MREAVRLLLVCDPESSSISIEEIDDTHLAYIALSTFSRPPSGS